MLLSITLGGSSWIISDQDNTSKSNPIEKPPFDWLKSNAPIYKLLYPIQDVPVAICYHPQIFQAPHIQRKKSSRVYFPELGYPMLPLPLFKSSNICYFVITVTGVIVSGRWFVHVPGTDVKCPGNSVTSNNRKWFPVAVNPSHRRKLPQSRYDRKIIFVLIGKRRKSERTHRQNFELLGPKPKDQPVENDPANKH